MSTTIPFYSGAQACCIDLFVYIISNSHKNSNNQRFSLYVSDIIQQTPMMSRRQKKQNKMKQPPSPVRQISTGLIQGL